MKKTAQTKRDPWVVVKSDGATLGVDDFLTTHFAQTSSLLRRVITVPYASAHGLSVSEWRILSLIAYGEPILFTDLVEKSTSDKALVSRTLRSLTLRKLAYTKSVDPAKTKPLVCHVTASGRALYEQVIPKAKRRQAEMILVLNETERKTLYRVMQKLRQACE